MTTKEKDIQKALGTYLPTVWNEARKLIEKGCTLEDKGDQLEAEGYTLVYEGDTLIAEGEKLRVKGWKLIAKGEKLFIGAVIEVYGKDMTIDWTSYGCRLSNGLEFSYL